MVDSHAPKIGRFLSRSLILRATPLMPVDITYRITVLFCVLSLSVQLLDQKMAELAQEPEGWDDVVRTSATYISAVHGCGALLSIGSLPHLFGACVAFCAFCVHYTSERCVLVTSVTTGFDGRHRVDGQAGRRAQQVQGVERGVGEGRALAVLAFLFGALRINDILYVPSKVPP